MSVIQYDVDRVDHIAHLFKRVERGEGASNVAQITHSVAMAEDRDSDTCQFFKLIYLMMEKHLKIGIIFALMLMSIYRLTTRLDKFTVDKSQTRLYIAPMWGIGNRLRTIRDAYTLSQILNKQLVIVEQHDKYFDANMQQLWHFPFSHVSMEDIQHEIGKNIVNVPYNDACSVKTQLEDLKTHGQSDVFVKACGFIIEDMPSNNDVYSLSQYQIPLAYKSFVDSVIANSSTMVGIHVRQGSVIDWKSGYFFSDDWKDISTREPESAPYFCCHEDKSKNLSACSSTQWLQPIEKYIAKMRSYPADTKFYVASDRVGCAIYLYQTFPGRVFMNDIKLEDGFIHVARDYVDFYCLSLCKEIVVSKVSSFADEARRVRDIPIVHVDG